MICVDIDGEDDHHDDDHHDHDHDDDDGDDIKSSERGPSDRSFRLSLIFGFLRFFQIPRMF